MEVVEEVYLGEEVSVVLGPEVHYPEEVSIKSAFLN